MSLQQLRNTYPVHHLQVAGHDIGYVRTHGSAAGGRLPLLLLPGAQGTAEIFHKQLLAWGGAVDMLSITYPALTEPEGLADAVFGLADALEIAEFDVLGSSYGGYLAQWLAALGGARGSQRVRRLVAGNSFQDPTPSQSADKLAALQAKSAGELRAEALARLQAAPEGEFKQTMLDLVGNQQPAELLRARMLAVQLARPVPPLHLDDRRLLLIECDNDPLIAPASREATRRHYPGAAVCAVAGGGHYPYLLKAPEYGAAVQAFLEAA